MAQAGKGVIARMLEGKEREEFVTRTKLNTTRTSFVWDLFKARFGRLMLVNVLTVLTFVPLIAVIIWRMYWVLSQGVLGNYGAPGILYPFYPYVTGTDELVVFQGDLIFFALMLPCLLLGALGLSGSSYMSRNLIWTKGVFTFSDYADGIKRGFLPCIEAVLIFGVCLFASRSIGNLAEYNVALSSPLTGWYIASEVIGYVLLGLSVPVCLWMVSLGTCFRLGPWGLFKTAVVMTFRTFPHTLLFSAIALWPIFLSLFGGAFFSVLGMVFLVLIGFVYMILVWMAYADWTFGQFVYGDAVPEEEKPAEAVQKPEKEEKSIVTLYGKAAFLSLPMRPLDEGPAPAAIPSEYCRRDLQTAALVHAEMVRDTKAFRAEHAKDAAYADYNKQFDELNRALPDKKKKKRKALKTQKR